MVTLNLVGRLVKDVELFSKQNGLNGDILYTNNTIVVEANGTDRTKTKVEYPKTPIYFNFVLFGNEAKYFSSTAFKGQKIAMTGEWQVDYYTDKNGEQRSQDVIKVFKWEPLEKSEEKQKQNTRQTNYVRKEKPQQPQQEEVVLQDNGEPLPF